MFPRGLAEGSGVETNTPLFLSPALKAPPPPRKLAPRLYRGGRRGLILL